jgi:hypothetical protein
MILYVLIVQQVIILRIMVERDVLCVSLHFKVVFLVKTVQYVKNVKLGISLTLLQICANYVQVQIVDVLRVILM